MDILQNELVKKYFNNAEEVISSMQEPIRKGERYLWWSIDYSGQWVEQTQTADIDGFHPFKLRLPDKFQKKECPNVSLECSCGKIVSHSAPDVRHPWRDECGCGIKLCAKCNGKCDEVEEKIEELANHYCAVTHPHSDCNKREQLRELVRLARESK